MEVFFEDQLTTDNTSEMTLLIEQVCPVFYNDSLADKVRLGGRRGA